MTDVLDWEERGFSAWPAPRNVYYGGWVFRLGGGYTKRANSANALGERHEMRADSINALAPARDFADVMAAAERFYAANGQPTIFRLTPLAGADADPLLEAAGYVLLDPSTVMTAALDAARSDESVRLTSGPTPAWLNGIAAAQGVAPSHRAIHDQIVQAIALPSACATAFVGDQAAAFGLGVADRGGGRPVRRHRPPGISRAGPRPRDHPRFDGVGPRRRRGRRLPSSDGRQPRGLATL